MEIVKAIFLGDPLEEKEHGVVVVRVREDEAVLPLREQEVKECFWERGIVRHCGVINLEPEGNWRYLFYF